MALFKLSPLLVLFFLVEYCRFTFSADPTSYFFDPIRAYLPGYSAQRKQEAFDFLQEESNLPFKRSINSTSPKLCIGISSVARKDVSYLRFSTGSLLSGLSCVERQQIELITLFPHADPSTHIDADSSWLSDVADQVLTYKEPFEKREYIQWLEETSGHEREKSIFDYIYLMKKCRETGAEYVLMLEDDTVAAAGWYKEAIQGLDSVATKSRASGSAGDDFLYLRLFYTEKFLGWNSESNGLYASVSFFIIFLFLAIGKILQTKCPNLLRHTSTVLLIALVYVPLLIGLFFLSGRPSMLPISRGVHLMPTHACCTQALVFPSIKIEGLVEWLDRHRIGSDRYQDQLIEMYAEGGTEGEKFGEQMAKWALTPSVVQHIGDKSSKAGAVAGWLNRGPRQRLWSFGFEREGTRVARYTQRQKPQVQGVFVTQWL